MKQKILKIIWDNLNPHHVTMNVGVQYQITYKIASVDMLVANMICAAINMENIDKVAELGKFIHDQWNDLEFSDENAENVCNKALSMWKEYNKIENMMERLS